MAAPVTCPSEWLESLASTRLATSSDQASSFLERDRDPKTGRLRVTLKCLQTEEEGGAAVAQLLLHHFVEATSSASRASQHGLLPRCVEITLPSVPQQAVAAAGSKQAEAAAGGKGGSDRQQRGAQQTWPRQLHVQFTCTEPAAEEQVEDAARLFEAFWHFHMKAAKSDLHCRMRSRLGALRQQLMLTKYL